MAEKKVGYTLTELANINKKLSDELEQHTSARNYLYSIACGEESYPELVIRPQNVGGPSVICAQIDMSKLPQEAVEILIYTLIEHEERLAFDTWEQLARNAQTACGTINEVNKMREKSKQAVSEDSEEVDYPATIPMQSKLEQQAEVPSGWPGKQPFKPTS